MPSETPWYGYLAIVAFYLLFEAVYRRLRKKFFVTHMVEEVIGTIRKLRKEMESDNEGAILCAWVMAINLVISATLILIFCIASVVKQRSWKDILLCVVLLVFLAPFVFALGLINELFMSWKKRIRTQP